MPPLWLKGNNLEIIVIKLGVVWLNTNLEFSIAMPSPVVGLNYDKLVVIYLDNCPNVE